VSVPACGIASCLLARYEKPESACHMFLPRRRLVAPFSAFDRLFSSVARNIYPSIQSIRYSLHARPGVVWCFSSICYVKVEQDTRNPRG
jgi:hypothetical protein